MSGNEQNGETVAMTEDRLSNRNLWAFSTGTVGRDFAYHLFNGFLLTYVLFTKNLSAAQFASISFIIIAARIFDAFNDPIMGGIVENTRTRWGKYKPWMLIGCVLTAGVIIATFSNGLDGWGFIGFLAAMYLLFSITFTMNDISYWGMMPSLTSHKQDRDKVTALSQICAGAGNAMAYGLVPILTAGAFTLGGNAVSAYRYVSIAAAVLFIGFQLITVLGVKEKPLAATLKEGERIGLKQMFKTIFKNDQLMWAALIMLIFNVGTNVVTGGLSMSYIYFEFGYNGFLLTIFGLLPGVFSMLATISFPFLSKRFGRKKLLAVSTMALVLGYALMLIVGISMPSDPWIAKFLLLMFCNCFAIFGGGLFYLINFIMIANTVEYNEWKTGKREEGLIFSLRPFTAKLGSALMQGLVMLVYLTVGVLAFTNQISDIENDVAKGIIDEAAKGDLINNVISSVPEGKKIALLVCMCMIPVVFILCAHFIARKKYTLDEKRYAEILAEINAREQKKAEADAAGE